jgi:hypothetical protein
VQREFIYNNERKADYLAEVRRMSKFFDGFEVQYVPQLNNCDVDYLWWITSSKALTPPDVIVERLSKPSVKATDSGEESFEHDMMVIDDLEQEPAYVWMQSIKMFLENQPPPDDNTEVEHSAWKNKQYQLVDDILFWLGANDMMMKCISREEGIRMLREIHSGICGSHLSSRSIIDKAFRHEFYWPTAKDDAMDVVIKCKDC